MQLKFVFSVERKRTLGTRKLVGIMLAAKVILHRNMIGKLLKHQRRLLVEPSKIEMQIKRKLLYCKRSTCTTCRRLRVDLANVPSIELDG